VVDGIFRVTQRSDETVRQHWIVFGNQDAHEYRPAAGMEFASEILRGVAQASRTRFLCVRFM
jgi:hypothetical protein